MPTKNILLTNARIGSLMIARDAKDPNVVTCVARYVLVASDPRFGIADRLTFTPTKTQLALIDQLLGEVALDVSAKENVTVEIMAPAFDVPSKEV